MLLTPDHFFLTSAPDIRELSAPLLSLGITHLSYSRNYNNGGRLYLSTSPRVIESYYSNKLYKIHATNSHPNNIQSQIILWSTLPNQTVFEAAKQMDIDHGIYFIESKKNYCEIFAFATKRDNYQIINSYLTHIDFLKKFTTHFKELGKNIIERGEQHKIYLPFQGKILPSLTTPHFPSIYKTPLNFLNKNSNTPVFLSQQQEKCLLLLSYGKSIKQIGLELNLSPRTVEAYLKTIRKIFGCSSSKELIFIYHESIK